MQTIRFLARFLFQIFIHRRVVRPLADITKSLTALASGKTDVVLVGGERRDEIGAMVRALLARNADPRGPPDALDSTPLHAMRNEEVARALVEAKAEPNAQDKKGQAPLHPPPTWATSEQLLHQAETEYTQLEYQSQWSSSVSSSA